MAPFTDSAGLPFLVALAWKSTLVLVLAGTLALLARGRSAALRHAIWTVAFGALLALPVLEAVTPPVAAPLPDVLASTGTARGDQAAERAAPSRPDNAGAPAVTKRSPTARPTFASPAAPRLALPDAREIARLVIPAWFAGMVAVLGFFAAGRIALARRLRRARPLVDATWLAAAAVVERRLGVARATRFLVAEDVPAPLTWGVFRATVLIPTHAVDWSGEQRHAFLVHELAHVARRDCAIQEAAHLACALYWFHPGAWLAAHRLRVEREPACDDLVLAEGADPAAYARQLIEVVRAGRVPRGVLALSGAAMAAPSRLEARVRALLDGGRDRRRVGRRGTLLAAALAAAVVIPLAAVVPAVSPPVSTAATPAPIVTGSTTGLAERWQSALREASGDAFWFAYAIPFAGGPESRETLLSDSDGWNADDLTRRGTSLAERLGCGERDAVVLLRVRRTSGADGPAFDRVALRSGRLSPDFGGLPVVAVGTIGLDESLTWLTARLGEAPDDRRAAVLVTALSLHDLPRTGPLLEEILESPRGSLVRAQAAEGLARHPGARSLEALVDHARVDASRDVRREAAEAIGDLDYGPATPALTALARELDDEAVRMEAVEALGVREPDRVVPVLVEVADDEHAPESVRREAVETLGDLPRNAGLEALRRLLRHPDPGVRDEAVETLHDMGERARNVAKEK